MLIIEQKEENSRVCYFDSTNILACKYVPDDKKLAIIFKGGTQYVYENITNYTFQRFKIADSQGKEFYKTIKGKFSFSKVEGKIDVTPIKEIIKEYLDNEE